MPSSKRQPGRSRPRWRDPRSIRRLGKVHGAPDRNSLFTGNIRQRSAAMSTWIIWLIVAVVLGTAEILTTTLAFGLLGLAALLAAGAGFFGADAAIQFGVFIATSALGLGVARPFALRHIRQPPLLRSGTAALIGRSALVLEEVGPHSGRVRI